MNYPINVFAAFLCLLTTSCTPTAGPFAPSFESGSGLRIYLQPLPQEFQSVSFRIAEISARRIDGTDVMIRKNLLVPAGPAWIDRQKRLLATKLPPGVYQGLVLQIEGATVATENGINALLVPVEPLLVEKAFTIRPDRTLALFLSLAGDRVITAGYRFAPTFSLWESLPVLPGLKGFASNTIYGTLLVFEKKTPAVTATMALGRMPGDIVLDQEGLWVYAALAGEDAIAAVDVVNEAVQAKIKLRPGDGPREIDLSADGRTLISANSGSHSVSIVDVGSLFERERLLLSSEPTSVFFNRSGDRAFVLHESTGTISMIDTRRPRIIASTQLETSPVRGVASADGRKLFLISAYSSDLLVLDASTLEVRGRKFVGSNALCLALDEISGLLYVGLLSGGIVAIDPRLDLPIDSFPISGAVSYLTIDREENTIFALIDGMRIEKYDLVSKNFLGAIEVGDGASAVSVMGEE